MLSAADAAICGRARVSKSRSSTISFLGEGGNQNARADFIPLPRAFLVILLYFTKIRRMLRGRVNITTRVRVTIVTDGATIFLARAEATEDAGHPGLATLRFSFGDTGFRWDVVEGWNKQTVGRRNAGWVFLRDLEI